MRKPVVTVFGKVIRLLPEHFEQKMKAGSVTQWSDRII